MSAADWETIYRLCAPSLRRFIRSRVPEALVEDALQDTFVRAYRSRARFDPARPALPWLLTIARRACSETLQKLPPEWPGDMVDLTPASVQDEPHPHFENRQRIEQMTRALSDLSARHRRLLLAWDMDGESPYPVLAAQEGISTKALKSALCRARTAFRHRYSVLAERTGVAALVACGPARLRARMQRLWGWWLSGSPLAEMALGGFAVAAVSVAVLLVPSSDVMGRVRHVAADAAVHPVGPPPTEATAAANRPSVVAGHVPATSAGEPTTPRGGDRSAGTPPASAGIGPIAARSGTDLGPDMAESTATFTISSINYSGDSTTFNQKTVFHCDTPTRQLVCGIGRATPLPQ